jgi:predicted DNA binding CopG/RHH family protein
MKLNGKTYRKVTTEEHKAFKKAIEKKLDVKLGRPFMDPKFKKKNVTLKLNPVLIEKLKKKAKKSGKPYQTLINEILEKAA